MDAASDDHNPRFARFDTLIFLVIAILVIAIGATILLGDRVGARVIRMAPHGTARSTEPIVIQFSEEMNRESVSERLSIAPAVDGAIVWNATTMIFQPERPLQPGESYTVTMNAGAESENGRKLLDDQSLTFNIRAPRVAFLAPSTGFPQNLYIADPRNPEETRQVTNTESGVFDFAVSPDGLTIAYAEYTPDYTAANIYLLDLETDAIQQITSCPEANCTSPVWRPDGQAIAYHRVETNSELTGGGLGPTRVWLVEIAGSVFNNRPLFDDYQIVGYSPRWSADGTRIALYDPNGRGVLVYDLSDESTQFIPGGTGTMGTLSPDGTKLVFADYVPAGEDALLRNHLLLADLTTDEVRDLSPETDAVEDTMPVWRPNGRDLAFGRLDVGITGARGAQVYLLNSETGDVEPLVIDPSYANGLLSWDPTGNQLVMQRFQLLDAQGQPTQTSTTEIWTYNLVTGELIQVATDAYLPQWAP